VKVDFSIAVVLVALAAIHIAEESVAGFRRFFNTEWFAGGENCPVGRAKGVLVDQIGLFLVIASLSILGAMIDARCILVAVGIITADLVQHAVFSFAKSKYTPGVATSALYFAFVLYFLGRRELRSLMYLDRAWLAMAVGFAFIAGNYFFSRWKVRSGRCGPGGADRPDSKLFIITFNPERYGRPLS
jgi:hypothetical protein